MYRVLPLLALFRASYAQTNPNYTVDVGDATPPINSPQVIAFNSLTGPYNHVIILSIDGFHQVRTLLDQ